MKLNGSRQGLVAWIITQAVVLNLLKPVHTKKSSTTSNIIRIEAFQNCPDRPNTTEYLKTHNYLTKVSLTRVKMDQFINAEYQVNRPLDTMQIVVNLLKCDSVDEKTCEHMMRMKLSLCDKISEKGQLWSPLVATIQPSPKCPLNKPLYRVVNGSFNSIAGVKYLASFPTGMDYYWGSKITFSDTKSTYEAGCMYLVFKIYKVRS